MSAPLIAVSGTNPGAGTTYLTAVLADLAALDGNTTIFDLGPYPDLKRLVTPRADATPKAPIYQPLAPITEDTAENAGAVIDAVRADVELVLATPTSMDWDSRLWLEQRADLRILVMEASGRGEQATLAWLDNTPDANTIIVVNAIPGGTPGTSARRHMNAVQEHVGPDTPVLPIRASIVIAGRLRGESPPCSARIRKHPMHDDYMNLWRSCQTHLATPVPTMCGASRWTPFGSFV